MNETSDQHRTIDRLTAEHGGESSVELFGLRGYGYVAFVACIDGKRFQVSEDGQAEPMQ